MLFYLFELSLVCLAATAATLPAKDSGSKKSIVQNSYFCDNFPTLCSQFSGGEGHHQATYARRDNEGEVDVDKKVTIADRTLCDYYPELCRTDESYNGGDFFPSLYKKANRRRESNASANQKRSQCASQCGNNRSCIYKCARFGTIYQ